MFRLPQKSPPSRVAFLFKRSAARCLRACGLAALIVIAGCARMPELGVTPIKQPNFDALESYLLTHKPDVDQFRLRGPFAVTADTNHEIAISPKEHIPADIFLAAPAGRAPLVIFVHGYASTKESHMFQAMHVASWGMHSLSVQLPNTGPWNSNGRTLARLVNFISRSPQAIDGRVDPGKIILVGHSFGGTSVMVALAEGARAAGGILLDPAGVGRDLPGYLAKVNVPVMVLGADEHLSVTRNRDYFYRFVRSGIAEVSIKGASHEDAQFPSEVAQTSEEMQISFTSALTAAALSLSATAKFDYAWSSFSDAVRSGKLFNAKAK
jgi:pimeloyl-ACP methyl ester carboxylesterase